MTFVCATLVMLVTLLVFGTFVAGKITRPISRLEDAMKDVEEGLKLIELDERGCNEVVSLSVHYNQMIERIRLLMAEIGEKEQAIRAYELNVLHSQINPHFLYNTLDTIVWMAEFGDSEKVIYITKALARFFRLSLSGGSERTTIGNELDHVRQYLMIQKERYGDQLDYKIDSVTDLDEVVIPKIILQPIVENSIYHGIRDMDGPGLVSVEVRNEENAIVFIVKDNGVGFDPESEVEDSKEGKTRLGGVGIRNVDERIKLTYGQKYGLTLNSAPGKGTEVVLRIPQGEKEQIDVK